MFTQLLALVSLITFARAGPFPDTPTGGQQVGKQCTIQWTADSTGIWKTMYIELMAGPNVPMQHLTTVATVDGTDSNNASYTYTCPDVSPNAPIFFYQFTSPFAPLDQTTWSSRFTIEGADGTSDAAPTSTQPGGAPTPWGTATLATPAAAQPAPTDVGAKVSGNAANGTASAAPSGGSASGAPSGSGSGLPVPSASGSGPAPSASASGGPLGVSTQSQISGSKTATGSGAPSGSAGGAAPTNGAVAVRGAPLYALGAVAAFAVLAL